MSAITPTPAAAVPASRTDRACRLVEWKPWLFENASLIGHASVLFSGGWQINRVPIFRTKDGGLSCGVPSVPELDSDGRIKERQGKRQYSPIIQFAAADARERWRNAILTALHDAGIGGAP